MYDRSPEYDRVIQTDVIQKDVQRTDGCIRVRENVPHYQECT